MVRECARTSSVVRVMVVGRVGDVLEVYCPSRGEIRVQWDDRNRDYGIETVIERRV